MEVGWVKEERREGKRADIYNRLRKVLKPPTTDRSLRLAPALFYCLFSNACKPFLTMQDFRASFF
jgi:hypothetical protein